MRGRDTIRNQQGFTLIEIIAVLVLIGILAAVAVPKYMDMQDSAKASSVAGALGAAAANVEVSFAKNLVDNSGGAPTTITGNAWDNTTDTAISTTVGDFTASYVATVTGTVPDHSISVLITITNGPAWFAASSATKTKTVVVK